MHLFETVQRTIILPLRSCGFIYVFNTYFDENKRSVNQGLILIEVGEFIISLAT